MVFPKKLHFFFLGPKALSRRGSSWWRWASILARWWALSMRSTGEMTTPSTSTLAGDFMDGTCQVFFGKDGISFFLVFPRFFHHHTLGECEKSRMKGGDITRIACLFPVPSDIGISGYLGRPLQEGWIWCFLRSLVVMQRATKVCGTSEAAILWV